MAAQTQEEATYMLTRSTEEIKRLNGQHPTMRAVLGDNLIHPSITPFSSKEYRSFADVATGTGIWLQDLRNRLRESSTYAGDGSSATTKEVEAGETKRKTEFVGFDISSAQFPPEGDKEAREGIEYVVHDMTKPFTAEYRERFDFVHVRFVGFALKAEDLSRGVENVCSLIRPGGYLQWEDTDPVDAFAAPETADTRKMVQCIIKERLARGLPVGTMTTLSKALQSLKTEVPPGKINVVSWTADQMRILNLSTLGSFSPSAPEQLKAQVGQMVLRALTQLLLAGVKRRERLIEEGNDSSDGGKTGGEEMRKLKEELAEMKELSGQVERGEGVAKSTWSSKLTLIVARKALVVAEEEGWMRAKRGSIA